MRVTSVSLLLVLCGCTGEKVVAPAPLTMDGQWRQSGDLRDAVSGDSHIHIGSFTIAQSGSAFSGSGTQTGDCVTPGAAHYTGPLADPTPFSIRGTLADRTVTFSRDICDFTGTFVAGRSDRITGTATCRYVENGVTRTFSGQWQADKL